MKTVVAALVALALPAAALAQTPPAAQPGAAASLPNTFDGPPQAARPTPASPAQAQTAATPSDPTKVAATEAMLKTTVAAMQAGAPNYSDMTPDLAEKVRAQAANLLPVFQQLGALQTITYLGTEDGAELFAVVFANAPTQWIMALNDEGKIAVVLFRPAPPPAA